MVPLVVDETQINMLSDFEIGMNYVIGEVVTVVTNNKPDIIYDVSSCRPRNANQYVKLLITDHELNNIRMLL
jgi:hypothetical protein